VKAPYTAEVYLGDINEYHRRPGNPDVTLTWEANLEDMKAGMAVGYRFWQTGHGGGVDGTLRAATLFIGKLLQPKESAIIVVKDREGKTTGRSALAKRAAFGAFYSDLGSRWGRIREFRGV
jgi:hypothetical protein